MTKEFRIVPILTILAAICMIDSGWADLDEEEFLQYSTGDLGGQKAWEVSVGDVRDNQGAQVVQNASGQQYVEFVGLTEEGGSLTRILKKLPPTNGSLVVIKLDFTPGNETVNGRLFFEQSGINNLVALSFTGGTLRVLPFEDDATATKMEVDTEILFDPAKKNRLELWVSFDTHNCQVFLNGVSAGDFPIPPSVQGIDLVNFYGGGEGFVSRLENLSITSVSSFPTPSQR